MKWVGIGLGALVLIAAAGWALAARGNARVEQDLRREPNGELAHKVMLIGFPEGRVLPVNYLREGDFVYAGADGPWWRALRGDGARVELLVRGETLFGQARAVEDDPERRADVFSRLRPTVPSWIPDRLDAVLVAVELDSNP